MNFKKKVCLAIGPVVVAFVLLLVIFTLPYPHPQVSDAQLDQAATALNKNVYQGETVLNQGLSKEKYVPFIGASELSRFNLLHPSVLAEKYQRQYRPFLVGLNGSTILNHYLMLDSLDEPPASGKVVIILALASFEDNAYQAMNFSHSYSNLQMKKWLSQLETVTENDQIFAEKLLKMPGAVSSPYMKSVLSDIKKGEQPNVIKKWLAKIDYRFSSNAEFIFGLDTTDKSETKKSDMYVYQNKLDKKLKDLPSTYDVNMLEEVANKYGSQYASGNDFKMYDSFYKKSVVPILKKYKGFYKERYHGASKGFSDLELLLSELSEKNLEAYFILPTMHEKWREYTSLSEKSITDLNKKLTMQLEEQGFHHILNMNDYKNDPYVMQDPLHIGWRGWVEVDRAIKPFLEGPKKAKTTYQLDPYFYSKDWQQYRP